MDNIETLIPDNEGNHLVVVLYFYDHNDKISSFNIPEQLANLDIADINIVKLDQYRPLNICAFLKMCRWLLEQFNMFPNAVFSFICSIDPIDSRHINMPPEQYRWNLFERFYSRNKRLLDDLKIKSNEIVVGPVGFQTYARVFYRDKHSPIIHLVMDNLSNKYST